MGWGGWVDDGESGSIEALFICLICHVFLDFLYIYDKNLDLMSKSHLSKNQNKKTTTTKTKKIIITSYMKAKTQIILHIPYVQSVFHYIPQYLVINLNEQQNS